MLYKLKESELIPHKSAWGGKGQEGNGKPATNDIVHSYRSIEQVACAMDAFMFPHADDLVAHD